LTSRKRQHRKPLSPVLALLLVLVVSVCFGQVLGKFYIGNISGDEDGKVDQGSYLPLLFEEGTGKKKVLRLKKLDYYSIRAGVFNEQEPAVLLGKTLAEKGLPAIVTGSSPHLVLVAFVNNNEVLLPLADSIRVDGEKAVVVKGVVNAVSFKFDANDAAAADIVAPFLGELSVSLNKGLLLYNSVSTRDEVMKNVKPKFAVLAREVEGLAGRGFEIAKTQKDSPYREAVYNIAQRCSDWAASLSNLDANFQDAQLLISQQMALALLEDYHGFIAGTN